MGKLIPFVVLAVVLAWVLAFTSEAATDARSHRNYVQSQRDMLALERAETWNELNQQHAPIIAGAGTVANVTLMIAGTLVLTGIGAALVLALWHWAQGIQHDRRYQMVQLRSQERVLVAEANNRWPDPPQSDARRWTLTEQANRAIPGDVTTEGGTDAPGALPGVVDLADLDFVPTAKRLLLGLGPDGQPITVSAQELMHTGIVGNTGGGKSNTGRLLLAQLLACKVPVVLADPHFAELDAESGEDWRPIARRLKLAPARKAGEIQDLFGWLQDEMHRRYDLRNAGEKWGPPIVAYVDELPSIVANVPGAMDVLAALLQEGRKVFLYVITSSQSLLTDVLKTPGEVRDNLRSCYYSGGATDSVVRLLDMPKRDVFTYEEQLGKGVVLLRSAATPRATLARVPLASNQGIARLLPDDIHIQAETIDMAIPRQDVGNTSAKAYSAAEQRILDMFAGGASIAEIAREISGAKNGRRYTEASEQAQAVIRQAVSSEQARAVGE